MREDTRPSENLLDYAFEVSPAGAARLDAAMAVREATRAAYLATCADIDALGPWYLQPASVQQARIVAETRAREAASAVYALMNQLIAEGLGHLVAQEEADHDHV